jgi:uncharacterized protein (TIGR00251 family)
LIHLENSDGGCFIEIHAQPGAKRNAIVGEHNSALRVAVTAVADKGKANQAIAKVLAEFFGLARSAVQLKSGQTSRRKRFVLHNLSAEKANALLAAHFEQSELS